MPAARTFPAVSGEKAQYAVHCTNDNTIRFMLRYSAPLDEDALCRATMALAMSTNVLHASFVPHNPSAYWRLTDVLAPGDCFASVSAAGDPMAQAIRIAVQPILPQGRVQLHVTLIRGESGCAVVLRLSHLVADGGDARYLLHILCEAYGQMLACGTADLAVRQGDRAPEQVYRALPLGEKLSLCKNPMLKIHSLFPYPDATSGEPRLTSTVLPKETFARARCRAKAAGATANDLLLTAFYRAFAVCAGAAPGTGAAIMSMMDLRAHLSPRQSEPGLCNLSGALPTSLPKGISGSFEDTLREIAAQTLAAKRDPHAGLYGLPLLHTLCRTLPTSLLVKAGAHAAGGMALGLTNLGSFSADALAMGGVLPIGLHFAGPLKKKPALQISTASLDGACALCVAGCHTEKDAAAVSQLLQLLANEITLYAGDAL